MRSTLTTTASFLAVGVPYWLTPYGQLGLPSSLLQPGLGVAVVAALLLRVWAGVSFWRSAVAIALTVVGAVVARVVWDGIKDATSHNLWPLEVAIALPIGLACSLVGAALGSLALRLVRGKAAAAS